jgi:hypothetical protein
LSTLLEVNHHSQEKGLTRKIGLVCILLIIILLAACSSAVENRPINVDEAVQAGVMATLTKEAWLEGVESARKTAIAAESQTGDDEDEGDSSSILPSLILIPLIMQMLDSLTAIIIKRIFTSGPLQPKKWITEG